MNDDGSRRSIRGIPVMWLVIGLPLLSIVAGVGLVVVAVRSGGADVVGDDVRRVSQIQTTDLGPDELARARELSAVLRLDADLVEVIPVGGRYERGAALELLLQHPTSAREDVRITLTPSDNGWRADTAVATDHDWLLQLQPADRSWRLRGRLPKAQRAARLAPSLQP